MSLILKKSKDIFFKKKIKIVFLKYLQFLKNSKYLKKKTAMLL